MPPNAGLPRELWIYISEFMYYNPAGKRRLEHVLRLPKGPAKLLVSDDWIQKISRAILFQSLNMEFNDHWFNVDFPYYRVSFFRLDKDGSKRYFTRIYSFKQCCCWSQNEISIGSKTVIHTHHHTFDFSSFIP